MALDVLLNMLLTLSKDCLGLRRVLVGGQLAEWPAPRSEAAAEEDDFSEVYRVSMNPMRLPTGVSEELELLDELGQPGGGDGDDDEDDDDEDDDNDVRRIVRGGR